MRPCYQESQTWTFKHSLRLLVQSVICVIELSIPPPRDTRYNLFTDGLIRLYDEIYR